MPSMQIQVSPIPASNILLSAIKDIAVRLADADVQPLTLNTAQIISSNFSLSPQAGARICTAIQHLHSTASVNNLLYFGVGVHHVVRRLAKEKDGIACLALCGCIAEVFTPETAAIILDELAMLYIKTENRPSQLEWTKLVQACQGVLTFTDFGWWAEHFMDLNRDAINPVNDGISDRGMGDPKDIAKALRGISSLTKSSADSMTIAGGSTCGWLAAVAFWFMGLTIDIRHPSRENNPSIFQGDCQDSRGRLIVEYSWHFFPGSANIESQTLEFHNIKQIVSSQPCHNDLPAGRFKWDGALRGTFGRAGKVFLEADATYHFLGSMARIFAAYARVEDEVRTEFERLQGWIGYRDSSYGYGFVSFGRHQFPELEKSDKKNLMLEYAEKTLENALQNLEWARRDLEILCECERCSKSSKKKTTFCLPILAKVLTLLIWSLSLVKFDVMDEEGMPMDLNRQGLEEFYHYHANLLAPKPPMNSLGKVSLFHRLFNLNLANISRLLTTGCQGLHKFYHFIASFFSTLHLPLNHGPTGLETEHLHPLLSLLNTPQLFATAEFVFAGGLSDPSPQPGRLASVSGCVCFYLDILCDPETNTSTPGKQIRNAPILHIVPGGIQLQSGRKCEGVQDGGDGDALVFCTEGTDFSLKGNDEDIRALDVIARGSMMQSLVTTETMADEKLRVVAQFSSTHGILEVGLRRMLDHTLRSTGTAKCPCGPNGGQLPSPPCTGVVLVHGEKYLPLRGIDVNVRNSVAVRLVYGDALVRCLGELVLPVRVRGKKLVDSQCYALFLKDECYSCCVRAVIEARGEGYNVLYKV